MDFLVWLETTGLGTWVRESPSLWAYPTILFLHTAGLTFLVGINAAVNLRLLGLASSLPVAPLGRFYRLMWYGFWVNLASGLLLVLADATTKATNPVLWVKLALIAAGLVVAVLIRKRVFRDPGFTDRLVPADVKMLAGISLLLWAGATTAGRLMAYIGPVAGLF